MPPSAASVNHNDSAGGRRDYAAADRHADRPRLISRAAADPPEQKETTLFTGVLQPTHLIILLVVALLFLGPKRLPDAGRALGQGLKEFKGSIAGSHPDDPQIAPAPDVTHEDTAPSQ
jgi:sec-independent protein translocase protein TatA